MKTKKSPAAAQQSQVFLRADADIQIQAEADGKVKRPTFKVAAYNGGALRVAGFFRPVVVDLAGLRAGAGGRVAMLKDHDPTQVCGQGTATITATGVVVEGQFTGDYEDKDQPCGMVVSHAKGGFTWAASIGAWPERTEFVDAGAKVTVNGREFAGPINVVRAARLGEVSFVAVGADETASATVAASAAERSVMFNEWLKARGFEPDKLTDAQQSSLQAAYDAEQKPAPVKAEPAPAPVQAAPVQADPVAALRASVAAEHERIASINKVAKEFPQIAAQAIRENWDVTKAELEVLRASRPIAAPAGIVRDNSADATAIEAAMCLTAGLPEQWVGQHISADKREQAMNQAVSARMRGFSLHALMDTVIAAAGRNFVGSRKSNDFIRAAYEANRAINASGFSSVSLSGILSTVANKSLAAAYDAVEVTWPTFCAVRSLSDFKAHTRYRLDSSGSFRKVGSTGELKHIGLSDDTFTLQADTYGALISLTRQMQINDDLGAFTQLPSLIGRLSAIRVEEGAYVSLLANTGSFFAAGNGNYISGATTALSMTSLTSAEQKFMDFVSDGKPVLVRPKTLLVGTALKTTADNLFAEKLLIASGLASTSTKTLEPARNPHAGKYPAIASPYINNTAIKDQDGAAITGQSSTAWFLFGDPSILAAIAIGFLNGQRTPTIESSDTSFETLGMQWRAYHDFGVGYEDEKGAVMSAGV